MVETWLEFVLRWGADPDVLDEELELTRDSCEHEEDVMRVRDLPRPARSCTNERVWEVARALEELERVDVLTRLRDLRGVLARPEADLLGLGASVVVRVRAARRELGLLEPQTLDDLVREAVGLDNGDFIDTRGPGVLVAVPPFLGHHARVLRARFGEVTGSDSFVVVPQGVAASMLENGRVPAGLVAPLGDDGLGAVGEEVLVTLATLLSDRRAGSGDLDLTVMLEVAREL
jgi:hypothetical protein